MFLFRQIARSSAAADGKEESGAMATERTQKTRRGMDFSTHSIMKGEYYRSENDWKLISDNGKPTSGKYRRGA
jgi:hypothetical protein